MFYMKKIGKKLLAFPLWIVFTLLSLIAKPMFLLFRVMCIPGVLMAGAGIYLSVTEGAYIQIIQYVIIAIISIALFFAIPHIKFWVIDAKDNLKEAAFFPIKVQAKQKFMVDYTYWENN